MAYYSFEAVRDGVPVRRYLADMGVKIVGNRAVASWRGGKRLTVAIYDDRAGKPDENAVYDNKTAERLSAIDLCMMLEGKTAVEAKIALAERYGIPGEDGTTVYKPKPKPVPPPCWCAVAAAVRAMMRVSGADMMREAVQALKDAERGCAGRVVELLGVGKTLGATLDDALLLASIEYGHLMGRKAVSDD